MRDTWRFSGDPDQEDASTPWFLPVWWALFVLYGIGNFIAGRIGDNTLAGARLFAAGTAITGVIGMVGAAVFLLLVYSLSAGQRATLQGQGYLIGGTVERQQAVATIGTASAG